MNCLEGYIGIRNLCGSENARIYLDELPGIDLIGLSDVVSDVSTVEELLNSSFYLGTNQVFADWLNLISDDYVINDNIGEIHIDTIGSTEIEITDNSLTLEFNRYKNDRYYNIYIKELAINVIPDNSSIDVTIETDYDQETFTIEKKSKVLILLRNKYYRSKKIEITLDSNDPLNITKSTNYPYNTFHNKYSCSPCDSVNGCFEFKGHENIGVLFSGSCAINKCSLLEDFFEDLRLPILYATGIQYLLAAKASNRVNYYVRNVEKIDFLLNEWRGAIDVTTGIKTNSQYWRYMKVAAEKTKTKIKNSRSDLFKRQGSYVCNSLP